jgi:enoyl-CoA hydratase/carnithine racemase
MIEVSRDGDVHIVTMTAEPNTVQPAFVSAMHEALDEIETAGAGAIVLTGTGKTFNAGLDLSVLKSLKGDDARGFGKTWMRALERLLVGPIPTVAAVNGHAFAAGAFLAMSCDFRFMRADRGWMCISEVDVGVAIGTPMMNILRRKLPAKVVGEAVLTGKRYAADDAIAAGFADGAASESDLLGVAIKHAAMLATKESRIIAKLKETLWADIAAGLEV